MFHHISIKEFSKKQNYFLQKLTVRRLLFFKKHLEASTDKQPIENPNKSQFRKDHPPKKNTSTHSFSCTCGFPTVPAGAEASFEMAVSLPEPLNEANDSINGDMVECFLYYKIKVMLWHYINAYTYYAQICVYHMQICYIWINKAVYKYTWYITYILYIISANIKYIYQSIYILRTSSRYCLW